jgi:hypothetical protein
MMRQHLKVVLKNAQLCYLICKCTCHEKHCSTQQNVLIFDNGKWVHPYEYIREIKDGNDMIDISRVQSIYLTELSK